MNEKEKLNFFLVKAFNGILKMEEKVLEQLCNKEISIKEFHIIEAIDMANKNGDSSMGPIADALYISDGTLSIAVNTLVKKGYIEKCKGADKRVVFLSLTEKGALANSSHKQYHSDMMDHLLTILSEEEVEILSSSIYKVLDFIENGYNK